MVARAQRGDIFGDGCWTMSHNLSPFPFWVCLQGAWKQAGKGFSSPKVIFNQSWAPTGQAQNPTGCPHPLGFAPLQPLSVSPQWGSLHEHCREDPPA